MKNSVLIIHLLFFNYSFGQVTWQETIGGGGIDVGYSIIQTTDGGYAGCGLTHYSIIPNDSDIYVFKLDSYGNLQWTKIIGSSYDDWSFSIVQCTDGGYALCGSTEYPSGFGEIDIYIVKIDGSGNLEWTKTIKYSSSTCCSSGRAIIQTTDGGYAVCGSGAGMYIIKLNSTGNVQWARMIGGGYDFAYSIIQTRDKGYAVCGYTNSYGMGGSDFYVVKLDSIGNLRWTRTIGGSGTDIGHAIIQTNDSGYAICGETQSFGAGLSDVYVVKLDSIGNLQWAKTIGAGGFEYGYSIVQSNDDGYAICGWTDSFGNDKLYLVRLDSIGNFQWSKTIGSSSVGYSITKCNDGGYVTCGYISSIGAGSYDVYIVKLDSNFNTCADINTVTSTAGNFGTTSNGGASLPTGTFVRSIGTVYQGGTATTICGAIGIEELAFKNVFKIYPNPAHDNFTVTFSEQLKMGNGELKIFDITGRVIHEQAIINQEPTIINSNLSAGVYFVKVSDGEKMYAQKLVIE